MDEQFSMADLRRTAAQIYSEELERSEKGSIANSAVIARIKNEHPEQVRAVATQLIDRQINKILNDARVRPGNGDNGEGPDLFGEYPNIRHSISVRRGETKALRHATVTEFERELKRRKERAERRLEDDELHKLWKTLKPFVISDLDTIADLWDRKNRRKEK